jgi:hypothetical protein
MGYPSWMSDFLQTKLFDEDEVHIHRFISRGAVMTIVGQTFEYVTSLITGGELVKNAPEHWESYPDVIDWGRKRKNKSDVLWESKGSNKSAPLLDLTQIQFYSRLVKNEFPFTSPRVFYILYSYDVKGLSNSFDNIPKMVKGICRSIQGAVVLDVETVVKIAERVTNYDYGVWCGESDRRKKYIRLNGVIAPLFQRADVVSFCAAMKLLGVTHEEYRRVFVKADILDFGTSKFPVVLPKSFSVIRGKIKWGGKVKEKPIVVSEDRRIDRVVDETTDEVLDF